mmetsp:Transcript_12240/g.16993  ORF Transcript_12240/g.16993 Transcript_12240/m.16993 type:complete len:104 (+) Transcript_12240:136-447(+)
MNFILANFTKNDWSDGNVIFINSTCFSKSLMEKIAAKAVHLVPGSCVVTLTQPIVSQSFELLESKKYEMSWGDATAHIHVRTRNPNIENKSRNWSKKSPGARI